MKVLGMDIGNAKTKLCLIDYNDSLDASRIIWESLPLPFGHDRQQDFEQGIPFNIALFLKMYDVNPTDLNCVVVCSSHSYSYPRFEESVTHLAAILQRQFSQQPVFLVSADGQLTDVQEISDISEEKRMAYVLTNFYGSAYLASQMIQNGLSLDIGTTTTDIIPIRDGLIDPDGLKFSEKYLDFRYRHHRINWLGMTATPLCALADHVNVGDRIYQTVPRDYRTDLIFSLLPQTQLKLMKRHAYFNQFPEPEKALERLPQFIGLDAYLLGEADTRQLAQELHDRLVNKVVLAIQAVLDEVFGGEKQSLEVAIFALGETLLATPALLKAGFQRHQFRYLNLKREEALWSASSVFAMALKGLQHLGEEVLL